MRFGTGIHPKQWHRGAWILALLLVAIVLVLTHRASGGGAYAMEPSPAPVGLPPEIAPPPPDEATQEAPPPGGMASDRPAEGAAPAPANPGIGYVAEIVDASYTVGPAEFFALDLPTVKDGARAVHLFGTVSTKSGKDIIVRLFRGADYDLWLKQRSGRKPLAFWTSPRSSSLTLDQDLPAGPVVMLLDNGYSIRNPKKVSCQLQLRYERATETFDTEAGKIARTTKSVVPEDNLPAPRSNSDEELPPPPPPPPGGF